MKILPSKDFQDSRFIYFDFSDTLYVEDIESARVSVDYFSGIGGNPSEELLDGTPIIQGLIIKQRIKKGDPYTTYKVKCTAFLNNGDVLSKEAVFSISGYLSLGTISVSTPP